MAQKIQIASNLFSISLPSTSSRQHISSKKFGSGLPRPLQGRHHFGFFGTYNCHFEEYSQCPRQHPDFRSTGPQYGISLQRCFRSTYLDPVPSERGRDHFDGKRERREDVVNVSVPFVSTYLDPAPSVRGRDHFDSYR